MTTSELLDGMSIIVPAAGKGSRLSAGVPKQYVALNGKPMLAHVIEKLCGLGASRIVVAIAPDDDTFGTLPCHERCTVAAGGATRAASVANALAGLDSAEDDWVLVHDAARPCVSEADIARLVKTVGDDRVGGILALPVVETVKSSGEDGRIASTLPRESLWLAQTPQMFRRGILARALASAQSARVEVTDEASAVERLGLSPMLVTGSRENIKVTTPDDIALAEFYLRREAV